MKNNLKTLLVLVLVTIISSCSRDQGNTDYLENRDNIVYFNSSTGSLFVEQGESNEYEITISSSSIAQSDANFTIEVDESSTAILDEDFTISSNTKIEQGNLVTSITVTGIYENSSLDGKTAILNLVGLDGVLVGQNNQFELDLIRSCPYTGLNTTSYDVTVFAFDDEAPSFSTTLVPVTGAENTWSVTSAWGPEFVAWATGNPIYSNMFLYSATFKIEDDFSVTVVGDDAWATGGTGVFNPCSQEMQVTLTQDLFTTGFTVDVVLTPN